MSQSISAPLVLEGKTAIVTGGGRGVGRAIAEALARNGAPVTVTARTEAEISEVASTIRETEGRAMAVPADVTDRRAVERMVSETERALGPVEILVNNAGQAGSGGPLWEWDPDDWWRTVEVNLRGLHVDDDLPALVRESERIRKGRLYSLRLLTLQGPRS
jgi:NAD(P)-dependent dehydrogenase (short-subunit alcohol dehydrogenase family)